MSGFSPLDWSFGLRNANGLYLTAEVFGFALNCSGKAMKKKQIFFLEQKGEKVFIKSHLGRYLTFKADGKFLADAVEPSSDEALTIEAQEDGRWALKTARGYYAGGSQDALDAYTKELKADRLWVVQLAMHPQVCIQNVNRKRYVHLSDAGDTLVCDEDIPWGSDAMITVIFLESGKYALQADNGKYLSDSSELKPVIDSSCSFTIDFFQKMVAFRSSSNKYLTALGASGLLKATKEGPPKCAPSVDEFFLFEDSQPQFKLKSKTSGLFASIKTSIELKCAASTCEDTEIFQFEPNTQTDQWSFRTCKGLFWSCQKDGSIQTATKPSAQGPSESFTVQWMGPIIALVASNGNFVSVKKNGQCVALSSVLSDECLFVYEIVNRPKLVLRGENGFVGPLPSGGLECNKSTPEVFSLHVSAGYCKISGRDGKFWKVGAESKVLANGDEPDLFTMEFMGNSKLLLKAPNGKYVQGQQNGSFAATGTAKDGSTLWEY